MRGRVTPIRRVRNWAPRVLLFGGLVGLGCSERTLYAPDDVGVLVVDAVLIVDQALPPILLSRSLSPDQAALPGGAPENEARVILIEAQQDTIQYEELPGGVYLTRPSSQRLVRPDTRYDLRVRSQAGEILTATTTTPEPLSEATWLLLDDSGTTIQRELRRYEEIGDGVYDAPENQLAYAQGLLEGRIARPDVIGFQFALFSLDLDSDFVIDPDFFDPEDFEELERDNVSPILESPDGVFRLPWFAVFFEGRYQVRLYAVDQNWFDYVRTLPALAAGGPGFGGNAGDSFTRPIFRVEGGIGLFGSASVDSIGFRILSRPE